jgi:hypothetical protein
MRIHLQCPYEDRAEAKLLGARWDVAQRTWYVLDQLDLTPFRKWIPLDRPVETKSREETDMRRQTLREYLAESYKGKTYSLTSKAARVFGVPYPPRAGWAEKYANNTACKADIPQRTKRGKTVGNKAVKRIDQSEKPVTTVSSPAYDCGCSHVLPWDNCAHTIQ